MSIRAITLQPSLPIDLFDGTCEADRAGIDLEASAQAFDRLLTARVAQAFPGVPVAPGARTMAVAIGSSAETYMEESQAEDTIRAIADELYDDGNLWMVEED